MLMRETSFRRRMVQEQETARAVELQKKTEARGRRAAKDSEKKIEIEFSGALSLKNKADLMDITQAHITATYYYYPPYIVH
jgi:hypothetical protein